MTRFPATFPLRGLFLLASTLLLLPVPAAVAQQDLKPREVQRLLQQSQIRLSESGQPLPVVTDYPEGSYIPGELIVRFRSGTVALPAGRTASTLTSAAVPDQVSAALQAMNVSALRKVFTSFEAADTMQTFRGQAPSSVPDLSQVYVLEFAGPTDVPARVAQLEALSEVLYAEPNFITVPDVVSEEATDIFGMPMKPRMPMVLQVPEDPQYYRQWALEQEQPNFDEDIDAEQAWDLQVGRYDVRMGILDSGIDPYHPDLGAGYGSGFKVVGGYDYIDDDPDPRGGTHGTHVAGIAAGLTNNLNSDGQREGIAGVAGGWGYDRSTQTGNLGPRLYAYRAVTGGTDALASAIYDASTLSETVFTS